MRALSDQIGTFHRSTVHAMRGIRYALTHERNFRIEMIIMGVVFLFMPLLDLVRWEQVVIIMMAMFVLIAELMNTVVERIVDILRPRVHPYARVIKDMMAATVVITACAALLIGLLIVLPSFVEAGIWLAGMYN